MQFDAKRTPPPNGVEDLEGPLHSRSGRPSFVGRVLSSAGSDYAVSALAGIAFVVLAEAAARNGWVSSLILPAPSDVWRALIDGLFNGAYFRHLISTVTAAAVGLVLATMLAIIVAGLFAMLGRLERAALPYVVGLQSMPKIAIAPLAILWLGFGQVAKVFVVVLVCFFPIFVSTLQGFKTQDREHMQLLRSLGASRWQVLRYLRLPAAIPYLFAGLQIGSVFALVGSVVAEFVGSRSGLGFVMLQEKGVFNLPGVFAVMLLMLVSGLLFHGTMRVLERSSGYWGETAAELKANG